MSRCQNSCEVRSQQAEGAGTRLQVSMSDRAAHEVEDLARIEVRQRRVFRHQPPGLLNCQIWVLQATQETFSYRNGRDNFEEGDLPESPQTSDCDWELLPDAAVPSSCGSSAKYANHTICQHSKVALLLFL